MFGFSLRSRQKLLSCYRRGGYLRLMRFFLFIGLVSLTFVLSPAKAEVQIDSLPSHSEGEAQLDRLYQDLKSQSNEVIARRIAERITKQLAQAGGATADLLIEWAEKAAKDEKYPVANDLLDQAIGLYPNYVETWNNRAMLHLMMDNYSMALADLSQALTIEPRHFGALNILAGILRISGRESMALDVYRQVLEIYPMHRAAQRAFIQLTEDSTDLSL